MAGPDKQALVAEIRAALAKEIAVLVESARSAREGATHEDAKPENDKDTRAIEAGYLAGAQAKRAFELERTAAQLEFLELKDFGPKDGVALSALVEVELDGKRCHYFFASAGGGMKLESGGVQVQVVTPEAPLGQALLGKTAGEVVELKKREYEILSVR